MVGQLASEKNHLHKVLTDSGVCLGVVVSDLHGQSARAMIKAIIAGQPSHEVLKLASRKEIFDALQGDLSACHRFVLKRHEHYLDLAIGYEARSVRRNTPCWIKTLTKFGFIPTSS